MDGFFVVSSIVEHLTFSDTCALCHDRCSNIAVTWTFICIVADHARRETFDSIRRDKGRQTQPPDQTDDGRGDDNGDQHAGVDASVCGGLERGRRVRRCKLLGASSKTTPQKSKPLHSWHEEIIRMERFQTGKRMTAFDFYYLWESMDIPLYRGAL